MQNLAFAGFFYGREKVKDFIIPALLSASVAVTGWNASTLIDGLRWLERLQTNQDYQVATISANSESLEHIELRLSKSERQLNEVPAIIARTLAIQSISSQLTELSTERTRLRRIVDGYTQRPASPEDEMDYLDVLDAIGGLCDELESTLGSTHRVCGQ